MRYLKCKVICRQKAIIFLNFLPIHLRKLKLNLTVVKLNVVKLLKSQSMSSKINKVKENIQMILYNTKEESPKSPKMKKILEDFLLSLSMRV